MKKIYNILGIAAVIAALVSCAEKEIDTPVGTDEEVTVDGIIFTATFEQPVSGDSKTVMGGEDNHSILWNKGDVIRIWDNEGNSGKFKAAQAGARSKFTKVSVEESFVPENATYAFYPESAVQSIEDNHIVKFTIPATQTYAENSFGQDANYAVSIAQTKYDEANDNEMYKELPFTNVAGVLKIQLTCDSGTQPVSVRRIVLKDKSQNICGTFSVDAAAEKPSAQYVENGGKKITLDCGNPGVALSTNPEKPTPFYITVPVGAIAQNSGFVAEVYNSHDHLVTVLKTSNANGNATIQRSHITKMTNKNFPWLPTDVTEYDYLKSHKVYQGYDPSIGRDFWGIQIINTGVDPSIEGGIRIQMKGIMDSPEAADGGYGNPSFCGLINPEDKVNWSPWISIDYHIGHGIRACFNGNGQYPNPAVDVNKIVDCDVCFFKGEGQFTGEINGTSFVSTADRELPAGSHFFLYAEGRTSDDGKTYAENRGECSIISFVMYNPADKMLRNFVPCVQDGVGGMWDMVEGKFYGPYTENRFCRGEFEYGSASY